MAQDNPAIDMPGYLRVAGEAAAHRATRRVSEAEFIRMSREPGTVILDARSKEKYDELHVKGAINVSFPDIASSTLQSAIPERATRILIYCNNNFANAAGPFPAKLASASLNLSTYIASTTTATAMCTSWRRSSTSPARSSSLNRARCGGRRRPSKARVAGA